MVENGGNNVKPIIDDPTLISVSEARRIMGDLSVSLSDTEIQEIIYNLTAIARTYVRSSFQNHMK